MTTHYEHQDAVGAYVRSRRTAALVSQDALAERAGVAAMDLARLENGVVVGTTLLTSVLGALPSGELGTPVPAVLLAHVPQQRVDGVTADTTQTATL